MDSRKVKLYPHLGASNHKIEAVYRIKSRGTYWLFHIMVKESQEWLLHQYAKFDDYFDLLNEAFADEVPYHCVYEDEYQGELGVSNDKLKKGDHFQFASGTEIKIEKIFSQWGKIIVAYSIKNEMDNMVYPTHIEDFIKLAKGSVLRWRNKEIS